MSQDFTLRQAKEPEVEGLFSTLLANRNAISLFLRSERDLILLCN
jgi:hypothetical protein